MNTLVIIYSTTYISIVSIILNANLKGIISHWYTMKNKIITSQLTRPTESGKNTSLESSASA